MLMTVQLPDHFVIPDTGSIQIRDAAEIGKPGFNTAEIIAAPPDRAPCFDLTTEYRYAANKNRSRTAINFTMDVRISED